MAWRPRLGLLMASKPVVRVTKDNTKAFLKGIQALATQRAYAGVPATTAGRKEEGQAINNAELMYIHENGAPEANIPARPVVVPAIKSAQPAITQALTLAAKAGANGDVAGVDKGLNAAGIIAQDAMRKKITTGPFAPLSPKTIAARAAKRGTKRRKGEQEYLDLVKGGMAPAKAQAAANIKPLIDTGQLRRALTYVIRKVKWTWKGRAL